LSRNQDRLGGVQQQDTSPPVQAMNEGTGGFSFVIPTEFVELPTGGRYYPPGHPLHNQSAIEIKQMTAKEEDMLTSRTLLKKGVALDRVIGSLIVNKAIDPDSLFIGDRNAILVATRVSGYGNDYQTKVACPACGTNQEYSFDLNDADVFCGDESNPMNVTDNHNGTFNVTLPKTNVIVTFKLLTGIDEKRLVAGVEADKKKRIDRGITRQLASMIIAVNEDDSIDAIKYLVENIPSSDSRHLRLAYKITAPNVDLTQHFECGECGHEQDMEVPLNADFFWPDR
jgi:hypothetical protein